MNETILIIAALAPGFIGIATNKLLNGDTSKEPLDANMFKYFLYATAALLLTECTPYASPLIKALNGQRLAPADILLPMLIAAACGAAWTLYLKNALAKIVSQILRLAGKNYTVGLSTSLIDRELLEDAEGHFIEITLPNGTKCTGALESYRAEDNTMLLSDNPEWTRDDDIEKYYKKSIVYLDTGTVIREYDYKYKDE